MKILRSPVALGGAAIALLLAIAAVATFVYIRPPGHMSVLFDTDDAGALEAGQQVRIAGVPVGKVTRLWLESSTVRVETRIADSVFVGDQSTVEIRMLTPVGGYYVNLTSLGSSPLDGESIPPERVTTPYSLTRVLNDAVRITDNVRTKPINEALDEIQHALDGDNTQSLRAIMDAGNSLMASVDQQRGQITAILNLVDEYSAQLAAMRDELRAMIEKLSIAQATLELYSKGFGSALDGMGQALERLKPLGLFYHSHREDFLEKVRSWIAKGRMWIERNGVVVRGLRAIQTHIERVISDQQAPPELLASDLCIPMPGAPCP